MVNIVALCHLTQLVILSPPLLGGLPGDHVMVSPLAFPLRLLLQGDLGVVLVDQVCHMVAIRLLPLRHETMLQLAIKVSDLMLLAGSEDFLLALLFLYRFVILQPL